MSIFNRNNGTTVPVKRTAGPMPSFQTEMNNLFNRFSSLTPWSDLPLMPELDMEFNPRLDIKENDKEYLLEAELPGMKESDIDLSLENNILIMKGEKKEEKKEERDNYYHMERSYGRFYRAVPFAAEIDEEKISAKYKDGVLKIAIAKSDNAVKSKKKINIQTA